MLASIIDELYHTAIAGGPVMIPIIFVGALGFYYIYCGFAKTMPTHKALHMSGVMAKVAPLLGLLGTVTGMVQTFKIITIYGNQNPALMADGISEALITTQSGLIVAFPIMLLNNRLAEKHGHI
ncbi:MAG: MotA/TolQ/ExbB proton channel family protein [Fibromonadaceae bacterium]|jgi:biopolymer transport protein ExbB|nr:MotA/TolQ/ExbB proton channel family protein [Fibromonadaceae bacterium]